MPKWCPASPSLGLLEGLPGPSKCPTIWPVDPAFWDKGRSPAQTNTGKLSASEGSLFRSLLFLDDQLT